MRGLWQEWIAGPCSPSQPLGLQRGKGAANRRWARGGWSHWLGLQRQVGWREHRAGATQEGTVEAGRGETGALKLASPSVTDGRRSQILGRQLLGEGTEDLKVTWAAPTLPTAPGTFRRRAKHLPPPSAFEWQARFCQHRPRSGRGASRAFSGVQSPLSPTRHSLTRYPPVSLSCIY